MAASWAPVEAAPEVVREAAAVHGLGIWYARYLARGGQGGATLATAAGTGGAAALLAGAAGPLPVLLAGVLGLGSVVLLCRVASRAHAGGGGDVYLFESGFVHVRAGRARSFGWRDITVHRETVRHGSSSAAVHTYRVRRPDGVGVVLDHTYDGIGELGRAVERGVTRARLPLAIDAVAGGGSVTFGRFTVDASGLREGRRAPVPWADVEDLHIANGAVGVRTRTARSVTPQPVKAQPIKDVPNVFVFVALTEAVLHAARSQGWR